MSTIGTPFLVLACLAAPSIIGWLTYGCAWLLARRWVKQ